MARDIQFDRTSMRSRLERAKRELDMFDQGSTMTVRQVPVATVADPVEGELIIDTATNNLMWYSNGVWRDCICPPVGNAYLRVQAGIAPNYVANAERDFPQANLVDASFEVYVPQTTLDIMEDQVIVTGGNIYLRLAEIGYSFGYHQSLTLATDYTGYYDYDLSLFVVTGNNGAKWTGEEGNIGLVIPNSWSLVNIQSSTVLATQTKMTVNGQSGAGAAHQGFTQTQFTVGLDNTYGQVDFVFYYRNIKVGTSTGAKDLVDFNDYDTDLSDFTTIDGNVTFNTVGPI